MLKILVFTSPNPVEKSCYYISQNKSNFCHSKIAENPWFCYISWHFSFKKCYKKIHDFISKLPHFNTTFYLQKTTSIFQFFLSSATRNPNDYCSFATKNNLVSSNFATWYFWMFFIFSTWNLFYLFLLATLTRTFSEKYSTSPFSFSLIFSTTFWFIFPFLSTKEKSPIPPFLFWLGVQPNQPFYIRISHFESWFTFSGRMVWIFVNSGQRFSRQGRLFFTLFTKGHLVLQKVGIALRGDFLVAKIFFSRQKCVFWQVKKSQKINS